MFLVEGAHDEERIVPEVVMHGGQPSGVHSVPDTGGWSVNDGPHRHPVGVLPPVAGQVGHVLPHKPSQDTVIVIIKQKLKIIYAFI